MPLVYSKRKGAISPPPGAVLVDRSTPYGNPFIVWKDREWVEYVTLYNKWIRKPEQQYLREKMKRNLKGKDLICWCCEEPKGCEDFPFICHGQVILQILGKLNHG